MAAADEELRHLVQMFSAPSEALAAVTPGDAAAGFALGYEVTPINLATKQPLAKAQVLSGAAAMAAHSLLMKIHSKKLVRLVV